jgi:membrane-associated phospholipid phosphatase
MQQQPKTHINKRFVITSSLVAIGLAILMLVSLDIQDSAGLATLDRPMLDWFSVHRHEWLTTAMHITTTLVSAEVLLVVAAIVSGVWYWRTRERWRPLLFMFSFGGAIAVAWVIKLVVERHRPLPDTMLPPLETGFSLPSIHTFGAAVFVLVLGYLLYSRQRRGLWLWIGAAVVFTMIAGITRLYLGYHWLTDLVASVGFALIALAIVITIDTYWQSKHRQLTKPKTLK